MNASRDGARWDSSKATTNNSADSTARTVPIQGVSSPCRDMRRSYPVINFLEPDEYLRSEPRGKSPGLFDLNQPPLENIVDRCTNITSMTAVPSPQLPQPFLALNLYCNLIPSTLPLLSPHSQDLQQNHPFQLLNDLHLGDMQPNHLWNPTTTQTTTTLNPTQPLPNT